MLNTILADPVRETLSVVIDGGVIELVLTRNDAGTIITIRLTPGEAQAIGAAIIVEAFAIVAQDQETVH